MPSVSQTVRVKVLFFGRIREITGKAEESSQLISGADIESLFLHCIERHPQLLQYRSSLVASCNREFSNWNTVLQDGDEVAFLPPVSGG
jgi:molybdopterin converting factor subunit 1